MIEVLEQFMMIPKKIFRCFLFIFLFGFLAMLILGFKMFTESDEPIYNEIVQMNFDEDIDHIPLDQEMHDTHLQWSIKKPIIIWWTPFTGDTGSYKRCGQIKCFFTVNRSYSQHSMTRAYMFYGSDFSIVDLPYPRHANQEWALLHEESPKNNFIFSHADMMTLFNHTSTFKRQSSYPITTQYLYSLDWLESVEYLVPTYKKNKQRKTLEPVMYAHSDCDVPSDRDNYVRMLMKHIGVDSYGKCLHNKELPEHLRDPLQGMDHVDFYKLTSKYKFSLAMENGICDDYITEKLWRPLLAGSVPIVMGSPKIKDFLPSNKSAIVVDDFKSIEELANYLIFLDGNDEEYNKYLEWKQTGVTNEYLRNLIKSRPWSINDNNEWARDDSNFIDGFECHVCKAIHDNEERALKGLDRIEHEVTVDHYGCPIPRHFDTHGVRKPEPQQMVHLSAWQSDWFQSSKIARAARQFIDKNETFTKADLVKAANI